MCYEFDSWHWKARAKELHKAQLKNNATEQKAEPVKPAQEAERKRTEVKQADKMPA